MSQYQRSFYKKLRKIADESYEIYINIDDGIESKEDLKRLHRDLSSLINLANDALVYWPDKETVETWVKELTE